jgi:GTP-binding protein
MSGSNFIDYVKICSRSGAGGAGSKHFFRAKGVPNGGPDGGDGGRGGHIILKGSTQLWTLLHLKYTKHVIASPGQGGMDGNKTGANGKDIIVEVPLGTVVREPESEEIRFEIVDDGQEVILTPGGRGGLGNWQFRTPTNQAPDYAQPGEPGKEEWVILELKVLADVGLVGFPNAGKSTLLSVISAAKPKIADYPFTTIVPNLGVVPYRGFKSFVVADIPGIIEGAAEGRGLGLRFLRHIERNSILLFMVPVTSENIKDEYDILLNELDEYSPELLDKTRVLALTKADILDEDEQKKVLAENQFGIPTILISSVTGLNIETLKDLLYTEITKA